MDRSGTLAVLRGNSGSGKSTVARALQRRFDRARCLVVSQDHVRRVMLRESDVADGANIALIETMAAWGLDRGMVVVVEGILNAGRYQRMLQRLSDRAASSAFFAWDLAFDETVRRHAQRPQRDDFTPEEMAGWFHGWQPLDFVEETRFDASTTAEHAVEEIERRIRGARQER